ncbi:BnaA04g21320D [Brassica napus]|uniref:BnaA04g21320D protein n=2 Tax=Brassica napus TaxID=3708 RepID=A0A078FVK4_BRANA|nr:BnaA04g21320D [Brassica napus]
MEEGEEKEDLRTVACLRGRLLAERQVSRSVKDEADLITRKMEELEKNLKKEIRLREKAEKRLKFLMKKLEFIKGSHSSERSEQLSSSEVSCLSSVSTSASKEEGEEKETHENGFVEEEKIDQETENVASMEEEEESSSKLKDVSSGEESVVASTSSHEAESQASNDFS